MAITPIRPFIREWRSIQVIWDPGSPPPDGTLLYECTVAYNAMKSKRTEVIEAALSVENDLDTVLSDLLIGSDEERRVMFRELVLAAEFCTFKQKTRMLGKLFEFDPDYFTSISGPQGKQLRRDLNAVIDDRNKFAHGDLVVDARDKSVSIRFFSDGTKLELVTESSVSDILLRSFEVRDALRRLHQQWEQPRTRSTSEPNEPTHKTTHKT